MPSSRLSRVFVVSAVLAAVCGLPQVSTAQPTTEADAVEQYRKLNVEAEQVHQDFLQATEDRKAKQAELDKANADLGDAQRAEVQARATQAEFRGQVDDLSSARFRGARFDKMSAFLTGTSQRDFLDRSTALSVLAAESNKTMATMANAVLAASDAQRKAAQAQQKASEARDAAARLTDQIAGKQKELDAKIATVKADLDRLTAAQKAQLAGPPEAPPAPPPPPKPTNPTTKAPPPPPPPGGGDGGGAADAAQRAVNAALSRRGDAYVWGGTAPGGFDCSGLTMWAYGQAGVKLPRTSRAQFGVGRSVSKDQLKPGDLLFYGGSASSIHHVAMYIGNGNIVHASTYGVPVKSAPLSNGGSDYYAAKRIVG